MKLQANKKQLAGILLSPHDGGDGGDKLGGLYVSIIQIFSTYLILMWEVESKVVALKVDVNFRIGQNRIVL